MKSTADCKKFLVDFFKATPDLIVQIYGGEDGKKVYEMALNEKNWKRRAKCKPLSEASYISGPKTMVWEKGKSYPKGPGYYPGIPFETSKIASERHFTLSEEILDTGVVYIVIETTDGELFLGEYIGD